MVNLVVLEVAEVSPLAVAEVAPVAEVAVAVEEVEPVEEMTMAEAEPAEVDVGVATAGRAGENKTYCNQSSSCENHRWPQ